MGAAETRTEKRTCESSTPPAQALRQLKTIQPAPTRAATPPAEAATVNLLDPDSDDDGFDDGDEIIYWTDRGFDFSPRICLVLI
mgnify:CR=1 FL=1